MKKKLSIGIITPFSLLGSLGGTEITVKMLSERLAESGHDVTVYSFDSDKYSRNKQNGINLIRFKHPRKIPNWKFELDRITYRNLQKIVKEHDILHVYMTVQIPSICKLGKKFDIPVVSTLNVYGPICPNSSLIHIDKPCNKFECLKCIKCIFYKDLLKDRNKITKVVDFLITVIYCKYSLRYKNLVDKHIAISETVKQKHVDNGFDERKIIVIPEMLDPAYQIQRKKIYNSVPVLLYVGRLDHRKGVDILIKAVPKILEEKEIEVWIVGGGRQKKKLERLIAERGLGDKVKLFGAVNYEKLPEIYGKADIFVHPVRFLEPFGRTLLEAMSFGLPIITSDIGVSPEIIEGCGLRFKMNDPQSLVDTVLKLLKDAQLKDSLIENGYLKLKNDYSSKTVTGKIISLYQDLLEAKRR